VNRSEINCLWNGAWLVFGARRRGAWWPVTNSFEQTVAPRERPPVDAAQREGVAPKHAHDIHTVEQAVHLVSEHVGVAILTKPAAGVSAQRVVVKPLSDTSLCLKTCVIMRTDNDSRLANEFARSFLRRYEPQILPPRQMELSLSA
jgi:hypothetical protein